MTVLPSVRRISSTFSTDRLAAMTAAGVLTIHEGHFLYPADPQGMHLTRFFSIEPLARHAQFVSWIAEDIAQWIATRQIQPDCLFAPAQAGVTTVAMAIAQHIGVSAALWPTLPSGRFCEPTGARATDFVEGGITPGARVLIFNGVTQQGRCVGQRLQDFAKTYGGETVGLAVVAKGTTGKVADLEREWGEDFYATIQIDIPVFPPAQCPLEGKSNTPLLQPWTMLRN